jgi:signal peptidase I
MARPPDEVEADDARAETILRDCLRTFDAVRLRVTGDCMTPAIRPGDLVTVTWAGARPPRLGDVVLFRAAGGLRLHRLVPGLPRHGSWLRLKADRAPHWDAPIDRADLIGTAVGIQRADQVLRPRSLVSALHSALRGLATRLHLW